MQIENILFFLTCVIIGGIVLFQTFVTMSENNFSKQLIFNFIVQALLFLYLGLELAISLFSNDITFLQEVDFRLTEDLFIIPSGLIGLVGLAISLEYKQKYEKDGNKFDKFIQYLFFLGFIITAILVITQIF